MPTKPPWMVSSRPDGKKLPVGCWNTQFQICNLETRQLEASVGESRSVVWGVAYRPSDPNILATCSGDGSVTMWDLNEQRNVLTLEPFGGADALSVSFTPDGKTLVAAGLLEFDRFAIDLADDPVVTVGRTPAARHRAC